MKIYNTLTREIEEFKPLDPKNIRLYSCGPTVYDYQHIGHMRRYVGDDLLIRTLKYNGYGVKHVMNITDVGHLTSDSDTGEDKMEKGAKKFGLSVWDIAKKFEQQFFDSIDQLNIKRPNVVMHATDFIKEQIDLIQTLEKKGYTYKTNDGIYFDTSKLSDYGKLTNQKKEDLKAGARVEMVPGKKNPTDFALWKFSSKGEKRQMEWESPWASPQTPERSDGRRGIGFPGWHIECSAMSMSELGPTLDIHTGGIDHIPVHHTNEIAQSEAATGKQFVNYWLHHAFLLVEGQKMSKSLGNIYTVDDVIKKGFDPLALRYLYMQTHYRQEMNFTWEALEAAQKALNRLKDQVSEMGSESKIGCAELEQKFLDAINDDLNMPKALAVVWETVNSDYPNSAKLESLYRFDEVLGLNIKVESGKLRVESLEIPEKVKNLVEERENFRKEKKFEEADKIREKIKNLGFEIQDLDNSETKVKKI